MAGSEPFNGLCCEGMLFAHRHAIPPFVFRDVHSLICPGDESFQM